MIKVILISCLDCIINEYYVEIFHVFHFAGMDGMLWSKVHGKLKICTRFSKEIEKSWKSIFGTNHRQSAKVTRTCWEPRRSKTTLSRSSATSGLTTRSSCQYPQHLFQNRHDDQQICRWQVQHITRKGVPRKEDIPMVEHGLNFY